MGRDARSWKEAVEAAIRSDTRSVVPLQAIYEVMVTSPPWSRPTILSRGDKESSRVTNVLSAQSSRRLWTKGRWRESDAGSIHSIQIRTLPTMAVRDWTQGQVVVLWCTLAMVTLLIAFGLAIWLDADGVSGLLILWALLFAAGSLPGLTITWVWLGGRRSN